MYTDNYFNRFELAPEVAEALKKCKCIAYAETKEELQEMAYGPTHTSRYDVVYPIEGLGHGQGGRGGALQERLRRSTSWRTICAAAIRTSMAIGDELPTDKPRLQGPLWL